MHILGKVKEITRITYETSISFPYIYSLINSVCPFFLHQNLSLSFQSHWFDLLDPWSWTEGVHNTTFQGSPTTLDSCIASQSSNLPHPVKSPCLLLLQCNSPTLLRTQGLQGQMKVFCLDWLCLSTLLPNRAPSSIEHTKTFSYQGICSCYAPPPPPPSGNNFSTYSNSTHPEGLAQVLPLPWNYQRSQFPLFWVPTVLIVWATQSGNYKASLQATNIHSLTSGLCILSWVPTSPALLLWEAPCSSPSQGLPSPLNRQAPIQGLRPLKSGCRGWKLDSSTLPAVVQARLVASLCRSFLRYKMGPIPPPTA